MIEKEILNAVNNSIEQLIINERQRGREEIVAVLNKRKEKNE